MSTAIENPPNPKTQPQQVVPSKLPRTVYPLIDNDPHFRRVVGYMRKEDLAVAAGTAAFAPAGMLWLEFISPSRVGRGGFAPIMRLSVGIGCIAGFILAFQRSSYRFYGVTENAREVDMDMREMVDKAKRGEPLYGVSSLTEHMQGVAARNSRYSAAFIQMLPMANFVNHNMHGVDTAKYYQQAERELEAERNTKEGVLTE